MEPLDMRPPLPLNYAEEKHRINEIQRPAVGPAEIKRLGHVGLKVSNLPRSVGWYADRFGLRTTDVLTAGPESHEVAAFLRLDRGSQPVDHHSIVLFESRKPEFHHCAFETQDYDAVETSHNWLRDHDWTHSFGVGRHLLGSQVFDYWLDPWGRKARALRRRRPVHRITRDRAAPHRPIANRPVGARAAPRLRRVMSRDSTTTAWSLVTYRTGDDPVERVGSLGPKGVVRAMPELCEYRGLMPALEDWPEVAAILEPLQGVRGGRKGPRSAPVPQEDPLRRSQLLVTSARNGRIPGPGGARGSLLLPPACHLDRGTRRGRPDRDSDR